MALVRFGGGISELRGSIAGNVFSRSRAGAIARNRAVPVNPNTPAQSQTRSWMQTATDGFRDLTGAQVTQWNEFAQTQTRFNRLGEPYTPSGKQLFTEAYLNNLSIGISTAPVLGMIESNPNLPSLTIGTSLATADAGALASLVMQTVSSNFGDVLLVQATPELQPSISNFTKYLRTINYFDPLVASPDLEPSYVSKFGTPMTVGNYIGLRASAINSATGLASEWVYDKVEVEAV